MALIDPSDRDFGMCQDDHAVFEQGAHKGSPLRLPRVFRRQPQSAISIIAIEKQEEGAEKKSYG
jgi:hypothetical protein